MTAHLPIFSQIPAWLVLESAANIADTMTCYEGSALLREAESTHDDIGLRSYSEI